MAYKQVQITGTISDFVSEAVSEIESLKEEISSWAENMEGNNLGHTPKGEEVRECADALDSLSEPNAPDCVDAALGGYTLTTSESAPTRRRQTPSRAVRRDNAVSRLTAVVCAIRDDEEEIRECLRVHHHELLFDENEPKRDISEEVDSLVDGDYDELTSYAEELESYYGEVEGIEFPGMF